jgi:hypothetical protein
MTALRTGDLTKEPDTLSLTYAPPQGDLMLGCADIQVRPNVCRVLAFLVGALVAGAATGGAPVADAKAAAAPVASAPPTPAQPTVPLVPAAADPSGH